MTSTSLSTPKEYAEHYSKEYGFSVFVLQNPENGTTTTEGELKNRKRPAVNWELYNVMRPSQIQLDRWFSKNPNYNLAATTGSISKAVGIDVDGPTAVKRIEEKRLEMSTNLRVALDNTMANRTGSGGLHIILRIEDYIGDLSQKVLWTDGKTHSQILLQGNGHYLVMPPSRHPNGQFYEWNGKDPQLITRQELNELIRLLRPNEEDQKEEEQQPNGLSIDRPLPPNDRTLTTDKMQELLRWVKPAYTPGNRDHMIFYLSGMFRKNGGYPLKDARAFITMLCKESGYPDEDLDKSLTVVDRTYIRPLDELNGKAGLRDLFVTGYQCANQMEYVDRAEAFSRICQIIDDNTTTDNTTAENNNKKKDLGTTWLSKLQAADKDLDVIATLTKEVLRLDHFKTLADTKEILWYHNGVYRPGGEDRILARLDELGGYDVHINIRREVTEFVKIKTITDRSEFDKDPLLRNFKNGIVCLGCGKRFAHDPDKYLSVIQIPHDYYTPEEMQQRLLADRPEGNRFLCRKIVFEFLCNVMDAPDIRLAIDYWGYCLIGDNRFQEDLMDVGPPDSGKSLHLNITKAYLGVKNLAHKPLKDLTEHRFAKADLFGKLANTCADISSSRLRDIEAFKLLSSGDDVDAEKKNRDPFSFVPFAKLMFSANTPPLPNEELDDAYYKRWILLVFGMKQKDFLDKSKDVKINPDLLREIEQDENELTDLVHLAVQAAMKLVREKGFSGGQRTRDIDLLREEYLRKATPVKAWVDDNCVLHPDYEGEKLILHADFLNYVAKEKLPGLTMIGLGRELQNLYPQVTNEQKGPRASRTYVWKGITLRSNLRADIQTEFGLLGEDREE